MIKSKGSILSAVEKQKEQIIDISKDRKKSLREEVYPKTSIALPKPPEADLELWLPSYEDS